jgi:hypothetical protein
LVARDKTFVLATPGMDRIWGRCRSLRPARDDFKGFEELKERLYRARPKDSTLDYAQRRA